MDADAGVPAMKWNYQPRRYLISSAQTSCNLKLYAQQLGGLDLNHMIRLTHALGRKVRLAAHQENVPLRMRPINKTTGSGIELPHRRSQ